MRALGVEATAWEEEPLRITGVGLSGLREPDDVLNAGNSGTTLRLVSGVLAGQSFLTVMTGDASLRRRPVDRIILPLSRMGAQCWARGQDRLPPLVIRGGGLTAIQYETPVASAQVKSAILLAGLFAEGVTTIIEPAMSRDHLERMLRAFGQPVDQDGTRISMSRARSLRAQRIRVPGDFSSAVFFLVAALCLPEGEVVLPDVGVNPTRAGLLEVLREMGAQYEVSGRRERGGEPVAELKGCASTLHGVAVGGSQIPQLIDEIPILAVAALVAEGSTTISDAAELRVKESDRIGVLASELARLGARIEERPDGLVIRGGAKLRGAVCHSHGDHRVAMALAIAGLLAEGETIIQSTDCIGTSFPQFVSILQELTAPESVVEER